MQLNKGMIISALNLLGIQYDKNKITSKNWMSCLCPQHSDKHFGNCSINLDSGIISCFACGQSVSIKKLLEERGLDSTLDLSQFNFIPISEVKREREIINHDYDFSFLPLNPEEYSYTKQRGYTKSYCEEFNIVHCISGEYADFIITSIVDTKRGIKTFEARKLKKDIVLEKYYSTMIKSRLSNEERFEKDCEERKYKIVKNQIIDKEGELCFSYDLFYLLKPKVLYPYGSGTWNTIFNIDNLDYNEDLWMSEGTGSHPKLYQHISKNSTACLGASITVEQIKILKNFKKRIIIVVDKDKAGYNLVLEMFKKLDNIYVCLIDVEDTDNIYVEKIKNCRLLGANEFLIKYTF